MRFLVISLLCGAAILDSGCFFLNRGGERGRVMDKWEASGQTFKIRVTEYEEKNPVMLTKFFYVFDSSSVGSNEWYEIAAIRTDDDIPIPTTQIRFVDSETGFFFMIYDYAVTTNEGHKWSVWNAQRDLTDWQNHRTFIKDVKIGTNGAGIMSLEPFDKRENPTIL